MPAPVTFPPGSLPPPGVYRLKGRNSPEDDKFLVVGPPGPPTAAHIIPRRGGGARCVFYQSGAGTFGSDGNDPQPPIGLACWPEPPPPHDPPWWYYRLWDAEGGIDGSMEWVMPLWNFAL